MTALADHQRIKNPVVYVLRNPHGQRKVGYSGDMVQRVETIEPKLPWPVELEMSFCHPLARKIEPIAHKIMDDARRNDSEWFDCDLDRIKNALSMASRVAEFRGRTESCARRSGYAFVGGWGRRIKEVPISNKTPRGQVEEIQLLIGDDDAQQGRLRIAFICGVKYSAITNWKTLGIPNANRASLFAYLTKNEFGIPDWLMDIPVPSKSEVDGIVGKKKQKNIIPFEKVA